MLKNKVIENNKSEDAITWTVKYLSVASEGYLFLLFLSKGIIDIKLISNPIQADIQE